MGQKPAKLTKPWVTSPFAIIESPTHRIGKPCARWGATAMANEMTVVHNHIIRILNAIYLQSPNVHEPQDIKDFANFMHAWLMLVHEHHGNEEELFFPWMEEYLEKPGHMQVNIEQHHAFEPGLKEFEKYVEGLREGKEKYDGLKVRNLIDSFGAILTEHLRDEIAFLETLEEFGDKIPWETLNKRITDHAVKTADTEFVIPIMLTNGDNTWETGIHDHFWPPFPFFVGWIFKYIHVPKQKGAWRFSSSDLNFNPRDLAFVDVKN